MSWGKHPIESAGHLEIQLGELGLHVKQAGCELRIESSHDGTFEDQPERWALYDPAEEISVAPCLPDRPILVAPRASLWLPPAGRTTLYVLLPLWVRVGISRPISMTLRELPSKQMHNVWLGSKVRGHLGFWHPSEPELQLPERQDSHFGVAPIEIYNDSTEPLEIESLEVDCPRLPLFRTDHGLWLGSSEIRYSLRGVSSSGAPGGLPAGVEQLEVLSAPGPLQVARSLRSRTFARLRALSPI